MNLNYVIFIILCMVSSSCDSISNSSDDPDNGNATTGKGGVAYKGEVLMTEHFNDTDFGSRGWYDVTEGAVLTLENPAPGNAQVLQCRYAKGDQKCADGYPVRIGIAGMWKTIARGVIPQ